MTQPRNFGFGPDETMLRDTARQFLADHFGIETLRRLRQVRLAEVQIMRACVAQIGLPNGESRKILASQVDPQLHQQVEDAAGCITWFARLVATQVRQNDAELFLKSGATEMLNQSLRNRAQNQVALAFSHIAFGGCFEQRIALEQNGAASADFCRRLFDQSGGDILQHYILQRKAGMHALHQRALAQGVQRLQDRLPGRPLHKVLAEFFRGHRLAFNCQPEHGLLLQRRQPGVLLLQQVCNPAKHNCLLA
jgi:hypothetical protein